MKTTTVAALILPAIASAHSTGRRACATQSDQPVFKISSYVEGRTYMDDYPERQPSCMARGQVYKSGDIMFEDENCESEQTLFTWHPDYTNQIVLLDDNMRVTDHCMMNLDSSPDFTGNRVAVLGDKTTGHGDCDTTDAVWETVLILKGESDEEVVLVKDVESNTCLQASNQEYADNSQTPDKYTLRDCEPNNPYQRFVLEVQCDLEVVTDKTETVTPDVTDCNTDHPVFTISSFVAGRTAMDDYPERQPSCMARGQVYKSGDIMYEDINCESQQKFAWHPDYDNQFVALDQDLVITDHCVMLLDGSLDFTGERQAVLGDDSKDHGDCSASKAIWETIDVDAYIKQEVVLIKDDVSRKCLQASNQQYADNQQTPDKYSLYDCEPANPYQHFVLRVDCNVSPSGY